MTFEPQLWDPVHPAAAELLREGWVPLRDATFSTLKVLRDVAGHPDVERADRELAAFAFSLLRVVIDQSGLSDERADAFAQVLAAQVYHQLPSAGRPAPDAFWQFLCDRTGTYARGLDRRTPNLGFVAVVGRFLRRYGLTPRADREIVRGLSRAVSPVVRHARRYVKARRESLEPKDPAAGTDQGLALFLDLDVEDLARVLDRVGSGEDEPPGGSERGDP